MAKLIDIPEGTAKYTLPVRRGDAVVDEEKETPFIEFLKALCDSYAPFAHGLKNGRQYDKIMETLESVDGRKTVRFEDADFEVLKAAAEQVQWVAPKVNRAYIKAGFYDALEKPQGVKV